MRRGSVGSAHHGRWGRDDLQGTAGADPVDVAVAVHDYRTYSERLELPEKTPAVDERCADSFGECRDRHWIFDQVVVQRDDPASLRVCADRRSEATGLLKGDHAERVGKGEMRVGI